MSEPELISEQHRATQNGIAADSMADEAPAGYGARLAWERERANLGVTDVAARLRLHPNQVRAIEQEDLDRLPEPAYVRGFVRSYARVLNIDPSAILGDLNSKLSTSHASVVDGMANTGDYSPVRAAARERMSRQLVIGVALAGLVALGVVGWQSTQQARQVEIPPVAPVPVAPVIAPVAETASQAPNVVVQESVPAAEPAPAESESLAEASAAPAPPTLLLRFSGASWVEVTDAKGQILLSQLSDAGAEHALDGALPLTVVIGDAGKTAVDVRGEAFNLQPFTRNNVARITIN